MDVLRSLQARMVFSGGASSHTGARRRQMSIYTRLSFSVVFLVPTIAISVEDDWWIEVAWLGAAIGLRRSE